MLANDYDGEADPLVVRKVWGATKGSLRVNRDHTVTYAARPGESGTDRFMYRVSDQHGRTGSAVVHVEIGPATSDPVRVAVSQPGSIEPVAQPEPSGPTVQTVTVTLHTTGDDKDRDERVHVLVRRGSEVLGESTAGAAEIWKPYSDSAVELHLRPAPAVADLSRLTLEVRKDPAGTELGFGWTVQAQVRAHLSDGTFVMLLPTTDPVKLGDDQASERSWPLQPTR